MRRGQRLFSLAILLVSLVAAEMLARLIVPHRTLPFVPSTNPGLIYELSPAYPGINSLGMRQGEIDAARLRHDVVIAVIGDSHTYATDSPSSATSFPARLEYHLGARGGPTISVLNLGVPGYNMIQELEVLRAKALRFEPDLVVLQYTVNDDHISNYIQPSYPRLNGLMHQSVLFTGLWTGVLYSDVGRTHLMPYVETHAPDLLLFTPGLVGTPVSRERDPAHGPTHPTRSKGLIPSRYHGFVGRENLERAVNSFGDVCRRADVPSLATGFIEDKDRNLYEAGGFQVYSFFDMFSGKDMGRYGYDPAKTDGHFSSRGNDFIGKALADYIHAHYSLHARRRTALAHTDASR